MATRKEIEQHYDTMGAMHALRMADVQGDYPDYSCAFFDGDFTKTYAQAQRDKHAWILDGLGLGQNLSGKRVLDVGCGWGPMLNAVRERGGEAVGLTLSSGQAEHCRKHGLERGIGGLLAGYSRGLAEPAAVTAHQSAADSED